MQYNFNIILKELRRTRKITAKDLASAVGLSESYFYQIESGKKPAPKNFIEKIIDIMNLNAKEMIMLSDAYERNIKQNFSNRDDIKQRLLNTKKHIISLVEEMFAKLFSGKQDESLLDKVIELLTNLKNDIFHSNYVKF